MNITPTQKLAWFYAAMFAVLGSLSFFPYINDANGVTLGIFKLEWYDNLLHYASGAWAAYAAWKSFKDSEFYFKLFGIIYGLSPYGLSRQIGISEDEAERFIASYFERYPKVKEFIDRTIKQARRDGSVRTLAGRRRRIEGLESSGATRRAAERVAVNTVVQGSAADLIKLAMIEIYRDLASASRQARMLIQIHDELVFEVPDEELEAVSRFVTEKMSGALKLNVPLKVAVATGKNWADAK